MFKNYLKTALRNLWRNRTYGFLNIFGLAIGIACAALIFLWVESEFTYNHYFKNRDNLYLVKNNQTYDGTTYTFDATPGLLANSMKAEIPGIANTTRMNWGSSLLFSLNDKNIYEKGNYVDPSFLTMFGLKFIKGDAANAFSQLYSLVITDEMARKFFGTDDVIGKTLKVSNERNYVITGVIEDLPENVNFKFEWLAPFKIFEDQNEWLKQWGNNGLMTWVQLQPSANVDIVNQKLKGYIQSKEPELISSIFLYSLNKIRLYNNFTNGKPDGGKILFVNLFSTIAWIILIIACINFMNLATARSEQRAREVGVRKVLGAAKQKLVFQFVGESLIMSFIAALIALGIVALILPAFNTLVEKHLELNILDPLHLGSLVSIAIICGLLAGSYPAFYLSSFNPVSVLKGLKIKTGNSAGYIRKGLVIVQFSISIILIISTILIYQQIQHVKDRDLGYNKQNLVYLSIQGRMKENFNVIKNDLLQTGVVENAVLSSDNVLQLGSNSGDFTWEGKDPNKKILITLENATSGYISTMGMQLKAGREFYNDNSGADSSNIIINETLAKLLNKKDVLGSIISSGDQNLTVVGVVKDFVFSDMYASPKPLIIFSDKSNVNFLTVRFKRNTNLKDNLAKLETVLKTDNPGYPVEYKFVDEQFNQLFKNEELVGKLASIFATLAIIISCLGLFGLAAYTAERRTKEIGIRKVLGASTTGLAGLLSKDFIQLVIVSCVLAFPMAWWAMHNFLNEFAYRIEISWWIFIVAGLVAVIIALITVSFQAVKAAWANPVKSLRSE